MQLHLPITLAPVVPTAKAPLTLSHTHVMHCEERVTARDGEGTHGLLVSPVVRDENIVSSTATFSDGS